MKVKNSGDITYPIHIGILTLQTQLNLEEFDDLLRKMVEFRVNYDECRNITEEVKEEDLEGEEYGIEGEFPREIINAAHQALIQANNRYREEQEAYEAERIAREEERLRNEYI